MLIRSQNKLMIMNLNNIEAVEIFGDTIRAFVGNTNDVLGRYSTEEKAIKVLDEITERFDSLQYFLRHPNSGESVKAVFNMPQEEEI